MPQEQMMTTAEYLRTPESLVPTELIYGKLRVAESPLPRHQAVVLDLTLALVSHVQERGSATSGSRRSTSFSTPSAR